MINDFFINLIRKYQRDISPELQRRGVECFFNPSCSEYAIGCLQRFNLVKAGFYIAYRLLSCNPINARRVRAKA
ncbi:MAG: membrane protein insertion efficiency factor YidD [Minisyncoccia bacterium]|jgi:putative membrane protein insertion efficiency factor